MKSKNLKKLISLVMMFAFTLSSVSITSLSAVASEGETVDGTETSSTNQMLHFMMKVRWGNVIGDSANSGETNFDGSIGVSSSARVSLERTLLFERHNITADKITKRKDPVSWNSLAYGHWDGVKVLISSPANDSVTIETTEGDVTMTAREFYDLNEPYIKDAGEGREIVVKTYPVGVGKNPNYFLKVYWGKVSRANYSKKFSLCHNTDGLFKIDNGGTLNLARTLRFEGKDLITGQSDTEINWNSDVCGGVDGILVNLKLDPDSLDFSNTITLNFTKSGWEKSFNILDLYHDRLTREVVTEDGYGVVLQVWKRPNRSLIRVKGDSKVYLVEDGVKQWIPSPEVLESQGLSFDDVEDVESEEANTYGDAEEVCYADGSIVQEEGADEVYVIADGEKKHITDPTAFTTLGYNWNNIVKVKPGALSFYRLRAAMKTNSVHPEGALIREEGTNTVYLIEGGKRKPILTQSIFNARRLNWNKVLVISSAQMNKFQSGANLQYPDGALVKVAGKVYKMDHGEKRWIRSGDDLTGAGYSTDDIIEVTDATEVADLEATVEGADIVADDVNEL